MRYSVHNPVTGAFEYFEGGPGVAINDDLPTPKYDASVRTKIGIPSSVAGRPLPPNARRVGSGKLPVGLISTGRVGVWSGTKKGSVPSGIGALGALGDATDTALAAVGWVGLAATLVLVTTVLYVNREEW